MRKLPEAKPRAGFFERDKYEAVRARLPEDLQTALTIHHSFGWRREEVLGLLRRNLDLQAETLRLDPGTTKNKDGRVVYLTPELKVLLAAQVARVKALERQAGKIIPWLFPHLTGARVQSTGQRHVAVVGERRRDFRRAWKRATEDAGAAGMLKHDLRRTAVRNMVNKRVHEDVAMKITGHKTRAGFSRYHIVSPEDLQRASALLAEK